jgi:hypothetical protein
MHKRGLIVRLAASNTRLVGRPQDRSNRGNTDEVVSPSCNSPAPAGLSSNATSRCLADGAEARALAANPHLAGIGNSCRGRTDLHCRLVLLRVHLRDRARRYWFGPFAAALPSILFHMIGTATGVTSVAMLTAMAKTQRLSIVISHLQQASRKPHVGIMLET